MPTKNESASDDIRNALQLISLVMERPAVKKAGDRATLVGYAELQMMKRRLTAALAKIDADTVIADITSDLAKMRSTDGDDFLRPLGASPSHYGFTVELRKGIGMFEIKEGTAHRALCTSFAMVMEWFKNNADGLDFACIGFSLDQQPYRKIWEDNS